MNKAIFIDFDGVFHPVNQSVPLHWHQVDVGNRFFLKEITTPFVRYCKRHQVDLVVSSAWRLDFTVDDFNEVFDGLVKAVTPFHLKDIPSKPDRWAEIQEYLASNLAIARFAVIDDQSKLFPHGLKNLIITNGEKGLRPEDLVKAHKILHSN